MKIEEGKIYKRRDGLKAFDVEIRNGLAYYYFELISSQDIHGTGCLS